MTDKPFGVNLTFLPAVTPPDYPGYIARHHRRRRQGGRDRRQQPAEVAAAR